MRKVLLITLLVFLCLQTYSNAYSYHVTNINQKSSSLDSPLSNIQWCGENPSND